MLLRGTTFNFFINFLSFMNKFLRLVSMFAIAGATFAYTSCTDYSEDINKANDRIDSVVSDVEALKPIKDQVESLKTTVAGLETAQTKAEATISELQKIGRASCRERA